MIVAEACSNAVTWPDVAWVVVVVIGTLAVLYMFGRWFL